MSCETSQSRVASGGGGTTDLGRTKFVLEGMTSYPVPLDEYVRGSTTRNVPSDNSPGNLVANRVKVAIFTSIIALQ